MTAAKQIADIIKTNRKRMGWSKLRLSNELDMSYGTICRWEAGIDKRKMMARNALKLEQLLGIKRGLIYSIYSGVDEHMNTFKKYRLHRGLSLHEASEVLNVRPSTIDHWELGNTHPNSLMIIAMSKLYNVTPNELLEFDNKR